MKKAKLFGLATVALTSTLVLAACGGNKSNDSEKKDAAKDNKSVAMVTDVGGVDDRSFNQSAWEGLQAWGKENGLKKGVGGYNYFQSDKESAYATNLNSAVQNGFKTIFGIGFKLQPEVEKAADQNKDYNFGIIDSVIEGKKNVVSATFKDNEASYLAGAAAAATTKTNKVGFIGGEEGVARAARDDGDFAPLHGFDGLPFAVMFADGKHVDGREYPRLLTYLFESRTQSQAVDDRGEHAHLVALDPVDSLGGSAQSTEDVSPADHDADFDAHLGNLFNLGGILVNSLFVDAILLFAHERLAAQFQKDSFVLVTHNCLVVR